ncbi:hypothetical protein M1271_07300 [Patescibacteria group bacterium]|nr:hypothetical protein [Patescibacteria group bacterium]
MDLVETSKLIIDWDGKTSPRDDELIRRLRCAYNGLLFCWIAEIKKEAIVPFSDYKPDIPDSFRNYFESHIRKGELLPLYLYPISEQKFRLSDDYVSFNLYLQKGFDKLPAIILGDSESKYIIKKSGPYQLLLPYLKVE